MGPPGRVRPAQQQKPDWKTLAAKYVSLVLLCLLFLAFYTLNNVAGSQMGYELPNYPSFLLYFTTTVYSLMFLCLSIYYKEAPFSKYHLSWAAQKHFLILGLLTALNGACYQFAVPWVDGALSQILASFITPFVFCTNLIILRDRFRAREVIGVIIVVAGIVVGMLPAIEKIARGQNNVQGTEQSDKWYWIVAFVMSVLFNALQQTWQDIVFRPPSQIKEAVCLFWYNMYSIIPYICIINFESVRIMNGSNTSYPLAHAWENQGHAFACFFGHPYPEDLVTPPGGGSPACPGKSIGWLWPTLFCVGYCGLFFTQAVLIRRFGAVFPNVVGALAPPLAAGIFSIRAIVGGAYRAFNWITGVSFAVIVIGVLLKGTPPKEYLDNMAKNDKRRRTLTEYSYRYKQIQDDSEEVSGVYR